LESRIFRLTWERCTVLRDRKNTNESTHPHGLTVVWRHNIVEPQTHQVIVEGSARIMLLVSGQIRTMVLEQVGQACTNLDHVLAETVLSNNA
jgi:hypothetical protein